MKSDQMNWNPIQCEKIQKNKKKKKKIRSKIKENFVEKEKLTSTLTHWTNPQATIKIMANANLLSTLKKNILLFRYFTCN